jgi:hypothetical protein
MTDEKKRPMTVADWRAFEQERTDPAGATWAKTQVAALLEPARLEARKREAEAAVKAAMVTQCRVLPAAAAKVDVLGLLDARASNGELVAKYGNGVVGRLDVNQLAYELARGIDRQRHLDPQAAVVREVGPAGVPADFARRFRMLDVNPETGIYTLQLPGRNADGHAPKPRKGTLPELLPMAVAEVVRQWTLEQRRQGVKELVEQMRRDPKSGRRF